MSRCMFKLTRTVILQSNRSMQIGGIPAMSSPWVANYISFSTLTRRAGPLNISLETAQHTNTASGTILRGRVVDLNGQPIPSALIQMQEVTRNDTTYSGPIDIDHYSICDDAGNFTVYATTPFTNAGGAAEAPGFSTGLFEGMDPSRSDQ